MAVGQISRRRGWSLRPLRRRPDLIALAALLLGTLLALLVFWRDTLPYIDDWDFWLPAPSYAPADLLDDYEGHPVLFLRLVWNLTTDITGGEQPAAYRLIFYAMHLATLALFYVVASPRIGRALALVATLPLALIGLALASYQSPLSGIMQGVAPLALLASIVLLERGSRRADIGACAVLVVATFTSGGGLVAVAGAAAWLLWPQFGSRFGRLWVPAIPAALFVVWYFAVSPDYGVRPIVDAALVPGFVSDGLSHGLRAYTYLPQDWAVGLAAALVVLLVWQGMRRNGVDRTLAAVIAAGIAYWGLLAVVRGPDVRPGEVRFLYVNAFLVALTVVVAAGLAGVRGKRRVVVTCGVLALAFAYPSANQMRLSAQSARENSLQGRAALAAVEIAGEQTPADFNPLQEIRGDDNFNVGAYRQALADGRSLAFDRSELDGLPERWRDVLDAMLVGAEQIKPQPATVRASAACRSEPREVAPGSSVTVRNGGTVEAPVLVSRYTERAREIGKLAPGAGATVAFPPDGSDRPWRVVATAPIAAC